MLLSVPNRTTANFNTIYFKRELIKGGYEQSNAFKWSEDPLEVIVLDSIGISCRLWSFTRGLKQFYGRLNKRNVCCTCCEVKLKVTQNWFDKNANFWSCGLPDTDLPPHTKIWKKDVSRSNWTHLMTHIIFKKIRTEVSDDNNFKSLKSAI